MTVQILKGDCREILRSLPDESVHCIVTSPPYWRQRDYGNDAQMGLEQTPEDYVAEMVAVFAECRRVLRSDGTCWVNIGDKWASGGNGGGGSFMAERAEAWSHVKQNKGWRKPPTGYKDKDLVGLPWMLAFAMRADGWFLRQCNIWAKPNGMPESVSDRSTASHEYVFHFSKNNDYFYNADDARTPAAPASETRLKQNIDAQEGSERANGGGKTNGPMKAVFGGRNKAAGYGTRRASGREDEGKYLEYGCNMRSVWWIAPANYREGHFAVMPEALAELCIVAGTSKSCCSLCGAPWVLGTSDMVSSAGQGSKRLWSKETYTSLKPTCECTEGGDGGRDDYGPPPAARSVVMDPFGGAGTTALVADRLGRNAVLIELNPEYADMAKRRIDTDAGMFAEVT